MSRRLRQALDVIELLTACLRDATQQLQEAVAIMQECPRCSQHVHRKEGQDP